MKKISLICLVAFFCINTIDELEAQLTALEILEKVDKNMSSDNRVSETTMLIRGRRRDRTVTSKSWTEGTTKSFTEYLAPARERGTKMLKIDDRLWVYAPGTDRTIQISGHLLRQSVMGSDLSYEDMMDDRKLTETYDAEIIEETSIEGRSCWVLELKAKVKNIAYQSQKLWIDQTRLVPLREELYAKSGQLLKKVDLKDVEQIDGRWYPKTIVYKDMLRKGKGTEFRIERITFDTEIPDYIFSKAALKQ